MISARTKINKQLLKFNNQEKSYLCQRLYSLYIRIHAEKNAIAKRRTGGSPWASLTHLCKKMGFKNHMGSRYLIMDLKKRLERSGMMIFNNEIVKGGNQASRFFIIAKIKEMAESFAEKSIKALEESICVCGDKSTDSRSHVYCSPIRGIFGLEVRTKVAAF